MCSKKFASGLVLVGFTAGFGLLGCDRQRVEDEQRVGEADQELYEESPLEPRTGARLDFNRYDTDADGTLSQDEFKRIYEDWDLDDDGKLTEDEFMF